MRAPVKFEKVDYYLISSIVGLLLKLRPTFADCMVHSLSVCNDLFLYFDQSSLLRILENLD